MKKFQILILFLLPLSGCAVSQVEAQFGPQTGLQMKSTLESAASKLMWMNRNRSCHVSHVSYAGSSCRFNEDKYLRKIAYVNPPWG